MSLTDVPNQKTISLDFLSGGGEMGERIRNFDWGQTSLGDPKNWQNSLKTCVRIMLTSPQPMFVWWSKELINIYNDAYRFVLGEKHPNALGTPGNVVWKEIWKEVGARADIVFNKNEGTFDDALLLIMNRHGCDEETYFKFSYNPIPGDNGGTEGLFCVCTEETERIINERSLKTLQQMDILAQKKTEQEVYEQALKALEINDRDFSFALIYKIEDDGSKAVLVASTDNTEDHSEIQKEINLEKPGINSTNVAKAVAENRLIESVNNGRWKKLPKGAWNVMPHDFVHVPIKAANKKFPLAILTVGLNPYRKFDTIYQNFVQLIADRISLAVNNVMAYEEEKKRIKALEKLDKAKTIFFSNISHEFRTPLTLMLGNIEEALNEHGSVPKNLDRMNATHRNAMRLLKLVNTLLDFSRIESGRQKAFYTLTDIVSYTNNLAANFRSVVENAGLKFIIKADSIIQPVYIDKQMWEKIVFNLLSNAFKYTLEGRISLRLFTDNENVFFEVEDTGVGIPQKELPHMFERFHRVENVVGRSYEGTGIGLSLIKELVQLHGGTINVKSTEGKGSTFIVKVPFGKEHLPAEQTYETQLDLEDVVSDAYIEEATSLLENRDHAYLGNGSTDHTSTILVVDDNADMRQHIRSLLQKHFTVLTATNGAEALDKIRSEKPSLVLSDIMMPVMDGIQLLKAIKEDVQYNRMPVILLTARAGEESRIEGYQTGADDYLVKPFSSKELLARIEAQIRIAKKRDNAEQNVYNLFDEVPFAVSVLKGKDLVIDYINKYNLNIWKHKKEDVLGKPLFEARPDLRAGVESIHNEVYHSGKRFIANEVAVEMTSDEKTETRYFNTIIDPMSDENGKIVGQLTTSIEVTDQVMARKKIEESEERFRTMANEAPLFVWETDGNLQTTYLNRAGLDYFDLDETVKMNDISWKKFIHPDDIENVLCIMNDAAKKNQSYSLEMRLKNGRTGEYHWFLDKGTPRYVNERFTGFIGTSLDIHDRLETEKELENKVKQRTGELNQQNILLKQQNHLVKKILDSSIDLIAVYDTDTRLISVNQSTLNGMRAKEEDVLGKKLLDIFPHMKDTQGYKDLMRAISGETIHNEVYYSPISNRHYENTLVPLKDHNDKIYAVLVMAHDNTELIVSSKKFEERNRFIEKLINSSLDLIMVVDKDLRLITLNKKAETVFGKVFKGPIIDEKIADFNPSVVGTQSYQDLLDAFKGNIIIRDKVKTTIGEEQYYEHNYVPLYNEDDEVYAVMVISHDITENIRQMEELRRLSESDVQKNNFIAMASHELKTPITSIKGYVQLLLNAFDKDKGKEKHLPPLLVRSSLISVDKQITRLTRLISELLDLTKIETGTLELKKENFSLNQLAIETVEDILYTNTKHEINLYHDFQAYVFADKDRIGQVMINFLTNAIKYSPDNNKIDVFIRQATNGRVAFTVKDNGIGIDKEEQGKIFERFYRAKGKEEQTYPGFGIGLFIANEFVQKHGGQVSVESERGKGSVFTFTLPVFK